MTREEEEALLAPIRAEAHRRAYGPICALCRHSPFTDTDLPLEFSPSDKAIPADYSIRTGRCAVLPLNITPLTGARCPRFHRQPQARGAEETA